MIYVVGAMFGGVDDQLPRFIQEGIWEMGYSDGEKPKYDRVFHDIIPGDTIIVKKRIGGRGSRSIQARMVGTVKRNTGTKLIIDWQRPLSAVADLKECWGTLSGPFSLNDPSRSSWLHELMA